MTGIEKNAVTGNVIEALAAPACTDAELLAIAQVRCLLGRRSESAFPAGVARDWGHLFRALLAARLPEDDCQQADMSALPVKHPSRVRAARTSGPGPATTWPPGSAATPPTPSGSTASASP